MTHRRKSEPHIPLDRLKRAISATIGFVPVALVILQESEGYLPAEIVAAGTGTLVVVSRILSDPALQTWAMTYAPWMYGTDNRPNNGKQDEVDGTAH